MEKKPIKYFTYHEIFNEYYTILERSEECKRQEEQAEQAERIRKEVLKMNEKKKINWLGILLDVVKIVLGAIAGTQL